MRKFTKKELKEILKKHKMWINNETGGERADLSYANLYYADLSYADLSYANLNHANLSYANLYYVDLNHANLNHANLNRANLYCADLYYADLSSAYLRYANLNHADLSSADLCSADLRSADLSYANLRSAENVPFVPYACPDCGSFIGYKKANGYIVELEILSDALRCSATSRKCRCNKAKVLSIQTLSGDIASVTEIASDRDKNFIYKVGEIVEVKDFDTNRWNECSTGIHFFINKQEAIDYQI